MTPMICKLIKAGHLARKLVRYIAGKAVGMTADFGFGEFKFRRPQLPWAIQALCSHHGESRAAEVRHVVLSLPKNTPRRQAKKLLRAVWQDWISTYAPGRAWMFGLQYHNGVFHGHGAVANVGDNARPLRMQPHHVLDMAAMKFTRWASGAGGSGGGKSRGVPVYSKAKKLAVRDLAALVVGPGGSLRKEVWAQLKKKGTISDFRLRKDGSVISFLFQDRRIRFSTLERFLTHQQPTKGTTTMPTASLNPTQSLPESLTEKLAKAGFSAKDLTILQSNLRSAHAAHQQHVTKARAVKKQPNPPKL